MSEAEPIRFGPSPSPAEAQEPTPAPAWAYLLRCPDGSLYGGWTNDLARRVKAHRSGKGGARYTKSHGRDAVRLAYAEKCADKSAALKREAALKKLPKADKETLAARWAADNKITLRMATPDDAAAVCALYNWYVRHGTQTFQYTPSTVEEYRANIAHVRENAPFILAESADGGCRALPVRTCGMSARRTRGMSRRRSTVRPTASVKVSAGGCTARCWRF